jgi:large subunit ribosomal protein L17
MRHGITTKKFGRKKSARTALMRSLARAIILHERIETSAAKAKALRPYIEKLVTLARLDTLARRRVINARLGNSLAETKKLFEIAKRFENRPGGYTRITKLVARDSDASPRAVIEFVD